jgi:hypothetical protein
MSSTQSTAMLFGRKVFMVMSLSAGGGSLKEKLNTHFEKQLG